MSGKSRWWNVLFRRKEETTTVELTDENVLDDVPAPPGLGAAGDVPSAGGFTFMPAEAARPVSAEAPALLMDTQPNVAVTTGRLKAIGLAPVLIPGLEEQVLLYRVVAQEIAATHPAEALARWQAVLALCPDDLEARVGAARAYVALDQSIEADAAWRGVLELSPDHPEANAAVSPTELRRAITTTEAE